MVISPQATDSNGVAIQTGSQQSVGKDDFLKLFVTKLRHQDPLNPMEDEAFIAQLAQFSSLEQLTNMNENLDASINWDVLNNQTINNSVAAQLIGNEVLAELNEVFLGSNNAPRISYDIPTEVASVTITVTDARGQIIRTLETDEATVGRNEIIWDGKDDHGERAPEGSYNISATAVDHDGGTVEPALSISGVVKGVVYRGGIAYLKLDGMEVALGDVREINSPDKEQGQNYNNNGNRGPVTDPLGDTGGTPKHVLWGNG